MKHAVLYPFILVALVTAMPVLKSPPVELPVIKEWGQNRPNYLLADRVEKEDRIIYGTDPEMEETFEEQRIEEKIKEERSWRMLENMNIYEKSGRRMEDGRPKAKER